LKVLRQNGQLAGLEHFRYVRRVRSAGQVREDQAVLVLIDLQEAGLDVLARIRKAIVTIVFGEAHFDVDFGQFVLEQIDLVEKENDGGLCKVFIVGDGFEDFDGFVDAVFLLVFVQRLVVLADGGHKDDGGHILEAVDPLPAFVALSADVEEFEVDVVNLERAFHDARRAQTGAQNIVACGGVFGFGDTVDRLIKINGAVEQLQQRALLVHLFDGGLVVPQVLHVLHDFVHPKNRPPTGRATP